LWLFRPEFFTRQRGKEGDKRDRHPTSSINARTLPQPTFGGPSSVRAAVERLLLIVMVRLLIVMVRLRHVG
jgi:hypothetical protein